MHIFTKMAKKDLEFFAEEGEKILREGAEDYLSKAESMAEKGQEKSAQLYLTHSKKYIDKLKKGNASILEYENRIKKINDILKD